MIVPCLFIKTQKGIVETENVRLNLITDVRKITNLKLKLDFYQEQAVSDVVKAAAYRIRFESDSGEIISMKCCMQRTARKKNQRTELLP